MTVSVQCKLTFFHMIIYYFMFRSCTDVTNFKCIRGNACIPKKFQCDGKKDCEDGSDETFCPSA